MALICYTDVRAQEIKYQFLYCLIELVSESELKRWLAKV
jgi:hypothetical protein